MNDEKPIGEYMCPDCGMVVLHDPKSIVIKYPLALGTPSAHIFCEECGRKIGAEIDWDDAILFEAIGAIVEGFNFVKAEKITDDEIDRFVKHIDKEIKEFLDACY